MGLCLSKACRAEKAANAKMVGLQADLLAKGVNAPPPDAPKDNSTMYIMAGVVLFIVIGIGAYFMLRK